jgi:hypothetical protein
MHPTPEAAAMGGFPAAHCRVLAIAVHGDYAFAVLDTGPAEYRYLYTGTVERDDGGWHACFDGNGGGCGWTITDMESGLGVVACRDEAPAGADAVRVAWRSEEREVPVQNGVYLVTWWDEPCPDGPFPEVVAFRVGGRWMPAPKR